MKMEYPLTQGLILFVVPQTWTSVQDEGLAR